MRESRPGQCGARFGRCRGRDRPVLLQRVPDEVFHSVTDAGQRIDPCLVASKVQGGRTLASPEVFEAILRALGITTTQLRPWADAWERVEESRNVGRGDGLGDHAPAPRQRWRRSALVAALAATLIGGAVVVFAVDGGVGVGACDYDIPATPVHTSHAG
ncbi:hypothetical protein [Allokutzneria sp. NRRL B-24872]|uniref:hypothetical protein n=1 Tax=Allokutzneria sp. NRRL B-24872 TaxID=1137961 RepID=UPI000A38C9E2|nr:hypothetical protein [Allokutzneria sp. NRRL B-24872]